MGKLSDLWADLKATSDETKKKEIQQDINNLERWCIEKGYAGIKEQTDWTKQKTRKVYRGENQRDGGFLIPPQGRTGKDMCKVCVYNKHTWCGMGMESDNPYFKPCMGKI